MNITCSYAWEHAWTSAQMCSGAWVMGNFIALSRFSFLFICFKFFLKMKMYCLRNKKYSKG